MRRRITLAHGSGGRVLGGAFRLVAFDRHQARLHESSGDADHLHRARAVELVVDKLPNTPARTTPTGMTARMFFGGLSGAAAGAGVGIIAYLAATVACMGALAGAFAGYNVRRMLVLRHLPDFSVALTEDVIAILWTAHHLAHLTRYSQRLGLSHLHIGRLQHCRL